MTVLTKAPDMPPVEGPPSRPEQGFRADIEGMRAIAVLLVVAFHAGLGVVSGGFVGVDVFFVISGYLITGVLLGDWAKRGTVSITTFYARRARRLLPLSTLVLLATAVVSYLVLPSLERPSVMHDIRAAALWFANWDFASSSTQYMSDTDKSPVLHFWSLSVEEQYYVVWPLLILLVIRGSRGLDALALRRRLLKVLALLGVGSLLLSGLTTHSKGPWAYFGLHTRAWELAAGAILAVGLPWLPRLTARGATLLGGTGLLLVTYSVLAFDRTTTFPGWAAVVPVLGTVLLLGSGGSAATPVTRLLSTSPMTYVGRISYAWYLWHWPCLVLGERIAGGSTDADVTGVAPSPHAGVVIAAVVVSFGLSALSHVVVERPVRRSVALNASVPMSLAAGATLVAAVLVVPPALHLDVSASSGKTVSTAAATRVTAQGKAALRKPKTPMTPAQAKKEVDDVPGCFVKFTERTASQKCLFGDPKGTKTVVLVGDSHAAHWFPAMELLAKREHWQLWFWSKAACAVSDVTVFTTQYNREYSECADWRASVLQRVQALPRVDAVVIGRSYGYLPILMDDGKRVSSNGIALQLWKSGTGRTLTQLAKATDNVVVLRETPRPGKDVPDCLSEHVTSPQRCAFPWQGHLHLDDKLVAAERSSAPKGLQLTLVDMSDVICPADPCQVVSPTGAITYRDKHHLTITFSKEIAPELLGRLEPIFS
jgi:peptidoglycan/LPS O-acetylase OafA/YrhL